MVLRFLTAKWLFRCEFTDMERNDWARSPFINQALFTPEYIYGVSLVSHTPSFVKQTPNSAAVDDVTFRAFAKP